MNLREQNYQFNVSNPGATDKDFSILGAAFNGTNISGNGGSSPPVYPLIRVPQSSTEQAQRDNQVSEFIIKSMQISVSDTNQLNMPFKIVTKDMAGASAQVPINLARFRNPLNKQANLVVLDDTTGFMPMRVWSDVGFSGIIKAGVNMDIYITFQYKNRPGYANFTGGNVNNIEDFIGYLAKNSALISGKAA